MGKAFSLFMSCNKYPVPFHKFSCTAHPTRQPRVFAGTRIVSRGYCEGLPGFCERGYEVVFRLTVAKVLGGCFIAEYLPALSACYPLGKLAQGFIIPIRGFNHFSGAFIRKSLAR